MITMDAKCLILVSHPDLVQMEKNVLQIVQLIVFALRRYGVPEFWIDLILSYYNGLWGRWRAGEVWSSWHLYEKGIFPGCTLSVILFLAAMNVILEYVVVEDVPRYKLGNGNELPLERAFMDDLTLMCATTSGMHTVASCWCGVEVGKDGCQTFKIS